MQGVVKAMAACVSDRDTNVRNAAINGMVACYREDGDKVRECVERGESLSLQIWSLAGKIEPKDKALVDERIKRSGATVGSAPPIPSTPNGRPGAKITVPSE